jgi:dihydrofolate reductase
MFSIIVAADLNNGIGKNGKLPWALKGDMKFFKEKTTDIFLPLESNYGQPINAVIMGRSTWESIPNKYKPLPERLNIVLSKNNESLSVLPDNVPGLTSFEMALKYCGDLTNINKIFVIGGAKLYSETMNHPDCNEIFLTRINKIFECDTFIPNIDKSFSIVQSTKQEENDIEYTFEIYKR